MAVGLLASVAVGLIGDALAPYALISSPLRSISTIIPDVVIDEVHTDDLAITDHPVETGAAISDHAFKIPSRVQMRCGFSNSSAGTEGYVQSVYQALLALQARREPFDVFTGKRVYRNMLLERVAVETNEASENTLMVIAGLREIILTRTQTAGASKDSQAMPEKTASTTDGGTTQMTTLDNPSGFSTAGNTSFLGGGTGLTTGGDVEIGEMISFDPANPSTTYVTPGSGESFSGPLFASGDTSNIATFGRYPSAFDAKGASLF